MGFMRDIMDKRRKALIYENEEHADIVGYADLDWASSVSERKYTVRCVLFVL